MIGGEGATVDWFDVVLRGFDACMMSATNAREIGRRHAMKNKYFRFG